VVGTSWRSAKEVLKPVASGAESVCWARATSVESAVVRCCSCRAACILAFLGGKEAGERKDNGKMGQGVE
jgi:hypothetical protein